MIMEKEYDIKYYEQNFKGDLKESSLLNFLQDIATLSAEDLGFGPSFVFKNNYAWVVLRYHIEIQEKLRNFSKIRIKTEPRGLSRLYAFRDFELFSPDGQCVVKAVSTWSLIDMTTRRILPMQKTLPMMFPFEKRDGDLNYQKTEFLDEPHFEFEKTFEVRFDDIDVNKHANNSNYLVWAMEALGQNFRQGHYVKCLDIRYKKEIGLNAIIQSVANKIEEDGKIFTLHSIKDSTTSEPLCDLKIEWAKENIG